MNNNSKNRNSMFGSTVRVFIPVLLLVVSMVAAYSLSWFAHNTSVMARGMSVSMNANVIALYQGGDSFKLVDDKDKIVSDQAEGNQITIPGTSAIYKVMLRNSSDHDIYIEGFGFEEPTVFTGTAQEAENFLNGKTAGVWEYEEFPRYTEGVSYYFGTQLKASLVRVTLLSTDSAGGTREEYSTGLYYLGNLFNKINDDCTPCDGGREGRTILQDPENPLVVPLYGPSYSAEDTDLIVPIDCVVVFYLKVEFENKSISQDPYKGFAFQNTDLTIDNYDKEHCGRSVYINFKSNN